MGRTRATQETRRQVRALFGVAGHGATPPRIGLEAEFLLLPAADRNGRVRIATVTRALASMPTLVRTGHPSFEPGGQLELSPAPAPSPALALARLDALTHQTSMALERSGVRMVAAGLDRWRSVEVLGLQTPKDRYRVMQAHFDRFGPSGRRMMRQTASLQVCIDRTPGPGAGRQWLAANLVGPALAAAFRTSPPGDNRTAVWLGVDPSRTGLDGRQVAAADPVDAYLGFALDAEVMPLPRLGEREEVRLDRTALGAWIARGLARPDGTDIRHHLSTLFPPVRPRGRYLEVRFLDAQPERSRIAAVTLVAILLGDPVAREAAIELVGDDPTGLGPAWIRSARSGLADPGLRSVARDLALVAAARVAPIDRRWPGWLPATARDSLEGLVAGLAAHEPRAMAS